MVGKQDSLSLLVRVPNWLGDCVMAFPGLAALSQLGFKLHLLGPSWLADVYSRDDWVYSVWPKQFKAQLNLMKSLPSKQMILLPNSFSSAWVARRARKETVGYHTDWRRFLLSYAYKKPLALHEVEYFALLMQKAAQVFGGASVDALDIKGSSLPLPQLVQQDARQILRSSGVLGAYCVICPFAVGAGERGQDKVWPHWQDLLDRLVERGITCVMCPGPQDIMSFPDSPGVFSLLDIGLGVYKSILADAQFVIANDTGPMHLAASVNTATLGVFGCTDPVRVRPWQGHFLGSVNHWPQLDSVVKWIDRRGLC